MTSARQQLKEIQERTRGFTYQIAEPQRTGSISDTEHTQEWFTHCDVWTRSKQMRLPGAISRSKSGAEEKASESALFWLTSQGLIQAYPI